MRKLLALGVWVAVGSLWLVNFAEQARAAAGSLTPPGPPGVLFKTLDEVEPRTPISSLPFAINRPGSFYVTTNLAGVSGQDGIRISANDVTIDLNGFSLEGLAGSLDGIFVSGSRTNIAIFNGVVRKWASDGIDCSTAYNSQLKDLRTSDNTFEGMQVGTGGLVINCTSRNNGQDGIDAGNGCTITGCAASANKESGITVDEACIVSDCSSSENALHGIAVVNGCRVVNNTCDGNGVGASTGSGIQAAGRENRIEGNNVTGNDVGLDLNSANNVVLNNSVRGNTDNYDFVAGNQINLLLSQIPETIDWPCAVVLAGSLTGVSGSNGLTIAANDVTIDLAGHSLVGVSGSLNGIAVSGNRTNITVRNGSLRGWGSYGLQATTSYNSRYADLQAVNNGGYGLGAGYGCLVKTCQARANGGIGIYGSSGCAISDCAASENGSDGIYTATAGTIVGCASFNNIRNGIYASSGSTVVNCSAYSNTNGVMANAGSTVRSCTAYNNYTNGIAVNSGSTVSDCTSYLNRVGINVASACRVLNSTMNGNTVAGILINGSDNRIEGNTCSGSASGFGIDCNPATGNLIIRNSASGNATPYSIAANNTVGPFYVGAGTIAGTNPWANFSF